jgi:hypothetical protein
MPYTYYYQNTPNPQIPVGSRAVASINNGAVCPISCDFGRVHGPSPARGSITFKGAFNSPAGGTVQIQIGQAMFEGIAVKSEIETSASSGANTKVNAVDMRDRLHDENRFAQYNMMDDEGKWWHIFIQDWEDQRKTFILKMEGFDDLPENVEAGGNVDLLAGDNISLYSIYNLMKKFSEDYDFTLSWGDGALALAKKTFPENLDWNSGIKIANAIEEILSRGNMQWTAWGNLHIHVTIRGKASNPFDEAILAGTVNLCSLGFTNASMGKEINEKGRRVIVLGGRNKEEYWYPCFPDWNLNFTLPLCFDIGPEFAQLLKQNNLTRLNLLERLPALYHDEAVPFPGAAFKDRKHGGKSRNELEIRQYISDFPYKCYIVDFSTPLKNITEAKESGQEDSFLKAIGGGGFNYDQWLNNDAGVMAVNNFSSFDSEYPISQALVTDSQRQFYVRAMSRQLYNKGVRTADQFARGVPAYINSGASLEIENYVFIDDVNGNNNKDPRHARELYSVSVIFSERKFKGEIEKENIATPQGNKEVLKFTNIKYDRVYIRLSLDKDVYSFTQGVGLGGVRVRERVIQSNDLYNSYSDGALKPLLSENLKERGLVLTTSAEKVAKKIATAALNHEQMTSAGHIEFRASAGYMPSGIIDNVKVNFSARSGVRETINFTNMFNDERVPTFYKTPTRSNRRLRGEEELARKALNEFTTKKIIKEKNDGIKQKKLGIANPSDNPNMLTEHQAFGGDGNAAMVSIPVNVIGQDIADGDILVVDEAV